MLYMCERVGRGSIKEGVGLMHSIQGLPNIDTRYEYLSGGKGMIGQWV